MNRIDADELSYCPWGVTPEPGYEYYVAGATCGAEEHLGHPACEPAAWDDIIARVNAGEMELIVHPTLTSRGWEAIVRKREQQ